MPNPVIHLGVIAAAFSLAGLVKGVTGLGLPTVGMGLLGLAMPPAQAAALLVVPAFITNVWQMISGPGLGRLARRLWLMQSGICLGTWAGAGLMTASKAGLASVALGGHWPDECACAACTGLGRVVARNFGRSRNGPHYRCYGRVCNTGRAVPSGPWLPGGRASEGARPLVHGLDNRTCLVSGRLRLTRSRH
jgi:hypothetical protein